MLVLNLSRFLLLKLWVFQRYMNNVYNWEYISEQSDILICIAFRNTKNGKLYFVCLIGFFSRLFCLCLLLFQTPTVSSSIVIPLPLLLTFHKSWTLRQIRAYLSWHPLCLLHVRIRSDNLSVNGKELEKLRLRSQEDWIILWVGTSLLLNVSFLSILICNQLDTIYFAYFPMKRTFNCIHAVYLVPFVFSS